MTVYLDMDGVLCDFTNGARRHAGLRENIEDMYPDNLDDVYQSIPAEQFWGSLTEDFWASLKPIPNGIDLAKRCLALFDTYILSAPTDGRSMAGKFFWLQKHLGEQVTHPLNRRFIFTPHKHFFARRGRVLIDDHQIHITRFKKSGGEGVLFRNQDAESITDYLEGLCLSS